MPQPSTRRALACPYPDCTTWALRALVDDLDDWDGHIWRCSNGHQGPRIIGLTPSASTAPERRNDAA